jgi:RimJ/RimL family protein N-acetyltransferase
LPRAVAFAAPANDGPIGSLASYAVWDRLAHISVITGGSQRGRGSGRAVVALAARHALDAGLVPQYRTLHSNAPSMALGRRLGFREYGLSIYVRL